MAEQYYTYIMANNRGSVLYVGVTNDLKRRAYEHKNKLAEGFTKKYNIGKLVYYEVCQNKEAAVSREKQLKGWLRQKKNELIATQNPRWRDLYDEL